MIIIMILIMILILHTHNAYSYSYWILIFRHILIGLFYTYTTIGTTSTTTSGNATRHYTVLWRRYLCSFHLDPPPD